MDSIIYLTGTGLVILILSSAYFLILSKQKSYNINRYYLLMIPFLSLLIPFMSFNFSTTGGLLPVMLDQLEVAESASYSFNYRNLFTLWNILFVIYAGGVLILLLKLINDLIKISKVLQSSSSEVIEGIPVYISLYTNDAFTFINKIIIPDKNTDTQILQHEYYHVKQLHFIDLLVAELVHIAFWFIPRIGLYKRAVVMNHEFSADRYSGSHGKVDDYCEQILSNAFRIKSFKACHTFNNYSLTKSRIKMMYKKESAPGRVFINLLMVIPFLVFAVLIASAKQEPYKINSNTISSLSGDEDVVQPQYPGGKEALYKFMGENVVFTDAAKAEGKEGTVFVKFVVSYTGKVKDVAVQKGVSDELDKEAVRVVSLMPDWIPGTKDGKKVNMEMTLPIKFVMK